MPAYIYKVSEYDHRAERQQFKAVAELLYRKYGNAPDPCILIGNYNIEGVELDALLITTGGVRILEFKNWGGKIVARENGQWLSDGRVIEGGAAQKTPYQQIKLNKSRASEGLKKLLGHLMDGQTLSATIIFSKKATIDTTQLSDRVRLWLSVCDKAHLESILNSNHTTLKPEAIMAIPALLRIEEFAVERDNDYTIPHPADIDVYRPETATELIAELERALGYAPNYHKVYAAFNSVLQRFVGQQLEQAKARFAGLYAKVDYLLKEHEASRELIWRTNDTRVRLRRFAQAADGDETASKEMEHYHLHDFRNLCQFIAFIADDEVPQSARAHYPVGELKPSQRQLIGDCMRVKVEQWDDDFVYATAEQATDGTTIKVCYGAANNAYGHDWTYLATLFYKDAQLNLVRPRLEGGIYYPELFIFEPDYLVDVSSVARCFTPYADSAFVHLLHKIEPRAASEAIVLGNLASQFLDESIHSQPGDKGYGQSVKDFFKSNALPLLTTPLGPKFHTEAQRQRRIIEDTISDKLPSLNKDFNAKEGMVEPSFFSETLGLQGRMDFLQLDYKVLLEQKSGKGGFPSDPKFVYPKYSEEHYVQLLLYMAIIRYNYRNVYEANKERLNAYLLYSKYAEPLVGIGSSPQTLHKALKIRNEMVWAEMLYTQPGGFRILESLSPDTLVKKKVSSPIWGNQIIETMRPLHEASELEKAYMLRFMTFIANEHVLAKMGSKEKECSGFASMWQDTLDDKLQAGNIYCGLHLQTPETTEGGIESVTLNYSEGQGNDMANFRVGDIVVVYPYDKGHTPDGRQTMVFRCTITDLQPDHVVLKLRAAQTDGRVFEKERGKLWAMEHDFMESSFSSLYRAMYAFLSAPKERKDLLLLQRAPRVDDTKRLKGDYGAFNELSLRVKQADDFFLIVGPPGTGKTSFGMLNTVKEQLLEPGTCVLLTAYTNRAVDEICGKLSAEEPAIDYIRLGGEQSCAEEYRSKLLCNRIQDCENIGDLRRQVAETRVFVGTTTALNSGLALLELKQFDLCVIDEASQILEPHIIGLLSHNKAGVPSIKKFVMIGDHKQLPAVVAQSQEVSRVHDVALNDIHLTDCRLSLFERLFKQYHDNSAVTYMLTRQGRMHHDIALFPSHAFYADRLKEVPLPHQQASLPLTGNGNDHIADLLATRRVAFIDVEAPEESPSDKVNQAEADIIAAIVMKIYERERETFDPLRTVGVIVPYRNQIATVRNTLDRQDIKILHDITIDTVERYQGSQRKYIIYGFTIQKYYQLRFLTGNVFIDIDGSLIDRKLNVAMTRAEEHLLLVGNARLLANNPTFNRLIDFIRRRQGYYKLGEA